MTSDTDTPPRILFEDPTAVRIYVELQEIEPVIWRRLLVPLHFNLAQLHHIIQAAFGWQDAHLHQFNIGGLRFGDAEFMEAERIDDDEPRTFEAAGVMLKDFSFNRDGGATFEYLYDFGDNWKHTIRLEEELVVKPMPKTATCLEGARSGPPEDVGGAHGYARFLRILLNPKEDELREQKELKVWSGGKFNPSAFDLTRTEKAVRGALRRHRNLG